MCKDMFSKASWSRLSVLSSWEAGCPPSSTQLPLPVPKSSACLSLTHRRIYPLNHVGPLLLKASVCPRVLCFGIPGIVSVLTSGV